MTCRVPFRLISQFNAGKNYYKTLGISTSATAAEVKKAYHDLARIYHPDAKTGNEAKFKDIAEAFEVLSDEQLRNQYNSTRNLREKPEEHRQKQTQREWKYTGADPFSGFEGAKSPFEQASRQEKARKAAETHEKWKQRARRSPPIDFPPWGQQGSPFRRPANPENSENRPEDAWIFELMAFGVLLTLGYWTLKTVYAIATVRQQPWEVEIDPQPVFRPVQRRGVEAEMGPVPRARVTRSRWQEGSPPQP